MNPFRFRDELTAQDLINCPDIKCRKTEHKIQEALNRYER